MLDFDNSRLYSLLRESKGLAKNLGMEVYLDHDSKLVDLTTIQFKRNNKPDVPAIVILKSMANAYQRKQFPASPKFVNNVIQTMPDEDSMMIQAADIIGNFSMAHVFANLTTVGQNRKDKSDMIEDVFGNMMEKPDFSKHIRIHNDDLVFFNGDYFSFKISWFLTGDHNKVEG